MNYTNVSTTMSPMNVNSGTEDDFSWLNVTRFEQCDSAYGELQHHLNNTILIPHGDLDTQSNIVDLVELRIHHTAFSYHHRFTACTNKITPVLDVFHHFEIVVNSSIKIMSGNVSSGLAAMREILSHYDEIDDLRTTTDAELDLECLSQYVRQEAEEYTIQIDAARQAYDPIRSILQNWLDFLEDLFLNNADTRFLREYLDGKITKMALAETLLSEVYLEEREEFYRRVDTMEQYRTQYNVDIAEVCSSPLLFYRHNGKISI